jgi:folate-binding protein YgfZ
MKRHASIASPSSASITSIHHQQGPFMNDEIHDANFVRDESTPYRFATSEPDAAVMQHYRLIVDEQGMLELPDRTQIELKGKDRQTFFHNLCTNEIKRLQPGQGCEAFVTNVQGKCLGHGFVFAGANALVFETSGGQAPALLPHLDKYLITEDVQLVDRTSDWSQWLLVGPQVESIVMRLPEIQALTTQAPATQSPPTQSPSKALLAAPYDHAELPLAGVMCWIRRLAWFQVPAFSIACPRADAAIVGESLEELGATRPPVGASELVFDMLRMEAAMPIFGQDVTDKNLPQEVGRDRLAINFNKGCYLGQETVARLDALGHVNRILTQLRLPAGTEIVPGAALIAAGQQVGQISSAAYSPRHQATIALGYVRVQHAQPGTPLTVGDVPAEVMEIQAGTP